MNTIAKKARIHHLEEDNDGFFSLLLNYQKEKHHILLYCVQKETY